MHIAAIIPARGGSRGIPGKNLVELCGKPLVAWSIDQARKSSRVSSVWVSSDSAEILEAAARFGASPIRRPGDISGDTASSESAWLHAVDSIESRGIRVDIVLGLQATSPVREPGDLDAAIERFEREGLDSLFSCCEVEDFFMWKLGDGGRPIGINHDPDHRKPRQLIEKRYLENGSFYLFTPGLLRMTGNRLGGRLGIHVMERHKSFQIDNLSDLKLCEAMLKGYGLDR